MCRACISTTTVCTDKMLAAVRVHTYSASRMHIHTVEDWNASRVLPARRRGPPSLTTAGTFYSVHLLWWQVMHEPLLRPTCMVWPG